MFLLCDDIRTMLWFCFMLWRCVLLHRSPVLERLLRVIHYVYTKDIKPKNGVYQHGGNSVHWELIRTTWNYFSDGIIRLNHFDMVLRRKVSSFDDRQLLSAIENYKQQLLKNLEDKLMSARDVSKANGFARETIESNIFECWKSLFDEEATSKELRSILLNDVFMPLLGETLHSEIQSLPIRTPYILWKDFAMQELKVEVVRLGVELSLYVAESMFLLCDDIRTMLGFFFKLWRGVLVDRSPVLERLLRVIHYVYTNKIKPKNGVYQYGGNSVHWELIRTTWKYFSDGVIILNRLDMALRGEGSSFDDRQLLSAIEKYKQQVLKKLEDNLKSAKDVSEANGFARETLESNIFECWKSLFDEEATSKELRSIILNNVFMPLMDETLPDEIQALPICSPYILGEDFAMQEVKVEVVRLGVELSLYVAESMFLLCDNIHSMLWFCNRVWRDAKRNVVNERHVVDRLLFFMHYVYMKDIKPKNGVYQNDGNNSVQWGLVRTTMENFVNGFRVLSFFVYYLRAGGICGQYFASNVEEEVKKVEEKLECVKVVSEANGFVRDVMESNILDLWKSLFENETEEATTTLKEIKNEIIRDLFLPLYNGAVPLD